MIEKVIGSPGCGKTTYLLNEIEKLLGSGESPDNIGFVTFTTAGVNEAKERAYKRFGISDLPYFKTLHAFAFFLLGLSRAQVFAGRFTKMFSDQANLKLSYGDYYSFSTKDDKLMFAINLSLATGESLKNTINNSKIKVSVEETLIIYEKYFKFKYAQGVYDFNDMLIMAKDCECPPIKTMIIDEAQDLSKLQWDFVNNLTRKSERVIIAGDDKQCIHTYGGADPKLFVGYPGVITNLEQSHRVPIAVQELADKVIDKVKVRHDVVWKARDYQGFVNYLSDFNVKIIKDYPGTFRILARNKSILKKYEEELLKTDELFLINDELPISKKVFKAIEVFEGDRADVELLKEFIPEKGFNTLIKLKRWDLAFLKLSNSEKNYVKLLLNKYKKTSQIVFKDARIRLSTIHASKGTEADYVILINGMTKAVYETYTDDIDAELRVLFVGITRAKKGLFIIQDKKHIAYKELL